MGTMRFFTTIVDDTWYQELEDSENFTQKSQPSNSWSTSANAVEFSMPLML